jgi:hypothetical protein
MQNVRSGDHLERIGETWYYRRVVPPDVRAAFGKGKVRFSLRTKSHTEAKRLEKQHDVDFETRLQQARGIGRHAHLSDLDSGTIEAILHDMDEEELTLNEEIEQFWKQELRGLIYSCHDDPHQWREMRDAILQIVKTYRNCSRGWLRGGLAPWA